MATLYGNESLSTIKHTQVYEATHGEGVKRLPYMKRSFISFRFGGKNIEDFNLIATTVSNSINRSGYAQFNDQTTSYDILNGQQYWGTHYAKNQIEFILATDGIDQKMLDEFLFWFQAGDTKELILAEHPNRAIYARVAEPPHLNLLPFEGQVEVKLAGGSYYTSTTLYKGEIELHLETDEPFWHAIMNILGKKENNEYTQVYYDVNQEREVNIFASQDALKILYEDGIPIGSMIQNDMLLGDNTFASVEDKVINRIWDLNEEQTKPNIENLSGGGACIAGIVDGVEYEGIIAGALVDADGNGIPSLAGGANAYFFYAGTAPSPTVIEFTIKPQFDEQGYISAPYNAHTNPKYNTLTIESVHSQELKFTIPNILTSYNKAIDIIRNQYTLVDQATLCDTLREEVRHQGAREWAVSVISNAETNSSNMITTELTSLITSMKSFLMEDQTTVTDMTFSFNSKTGQAIGQFSYRTSLNSTQNELISVKEDVGDMLRSNYIILRDRNYPTQNGVINGWTENNKEWSHRIYHNMSIPMKNLIITYQNMYL